jgi:hypothetical protein
METRIKEYLRPLSGAARQSALARLRDAIGAEAKARQSESRFWTTVEESTAFRALAAGSGATVTNRIQENLTRREPFAPPPRLTFVTPSSVAIYSPPPQSPGGHHPGVPTPGLSSVWRVRNSRDNVGLGPIYGHIRNHLPSQSPLSVAVRVAAAVPHKRSGPWGWIGGARLASAAATFTSPNHRSLAGAAPI